MQERRPPACAVRRYSDNLGAIPLVTRGPGRVISQRVEGRWRKKSNNGGYSLAAICVLITLAVGKCGGSSVPNAEEANQLVASGSSAIETTRMFVAIANLNCRAKPEAHAPVFEKLVRGDAVSVGATQRSWVGLDRPGATCWVAQRFLSENELEPVPTPADVRLLSPPSNDPLNAVSLRPSGPSCGTKWKCGQMNSCTEAYHYLNECGVDRLDGDSDGVPCESIC
jgi:hypothetical protein